MKKFATTVHAPVELEGRTLEGRVFISYADDVATAKWLVKRFLTEHTTIVHPLTCMETVEE